MGIRRWRENTNEEGDGVDDGRFGDVKSGTMPRDPPVHVVRTVRADILIRVTNIRIQKQFKSI